MPKVEFSGDEVGDGLDKLLREPGVTPKPFCMTCGRDLVPGWDRTEVRGKGTAYGANDIM